MLAVVAAVKEGIWVGVLVPMWSGTTVTRWMRTLGTVDAASEVLHEDRVSSYSGSLIQSRRSARKSVKVGASGTENGALDNPRPATAEEVQAAERELRVPLPHDFLAVAAVQQGRRPKPSSFQLPNGVGEGVEHLLHFAEGSFSNIVTRGFAVKGVLDKGIIPFAEALGSNLLCFDYRTDYDHPRVEFWSTDTGRPR